MGILNTSLRLATLGKRKRGQLQIQETILTIFIFIVLIMFGMIFFYRVQTSSIANDFREFEREKQSVDFITLGDLPEFSCSKMGIKENCIDVTKLIAFMSLVGNNQTKGYYFERFGYQNITIQQVYPEKNINKCSISRMEDCGQWNVYIKRPAKVTSKTVRETPVSLYFPDKDEYSIGIMVVEAYA